MATDLNPVKVRQGKKKTVVIITAAVLLMAAAAFIGVRIYQDIQNHITVTFDTNGGSAVQAVKLEKGSVLSSIPCTSKNNYSFTGWFYDGDLTVPYNSEDQFNENTVLYASYEDDEESGVVESGTIYEDDCDARSAVVVRSDDEVTADNLSNYLDISSSVGDMPSSFSVKPLGDGKYEVTPNQDYQAGFAYDFNAKNGASLVSGEDDTLQTITQRIHKDKVEKVDLKKEIVYVDWDDVVREDEAYDIYIPKSTEYTLSEGTPICFLDDYNEWVSAGKDIDTLGSLYGDSMLFVSVETITDKFVSKESNKGFLTGKDWYYVSVEDAQLEDIINDVDVYVEESIRAEDVLDTEQIEKGILASEGIDQLGDIISCAVMDDENFQKLEAGESVSDTSLLTPFSVSAAEMSGIPFRDGLSMGNATKFPVVKKNGVTVNIAWNGNGASNPNFPGCDASDTDNNKWSAMQVEVQFDMTINGIDVNATTDITEYLKLTMQGWKEWHGLKLQFDYALNIYSQVTFDFNVKIREKNGEWLDVSESVTSKMTSEEMLKRYKDIINADTDFITLCDETIVKGGFKVIPIIPIFSIDLSLNYTLRLDLAAGVSSNFTHLDAIQVGMTGTTGGGIKSYKHELSGSDRYAYNFNACGRIGVETGLKGELTLSFNGLSDYGKVGISIEVGFYADLYGYVNFSLKKMHHNSTVEKNFNGGYYVEMGLYLEIRSVIASEKFGLDAGTSLFKKKWPLFTLGNRYVVYDIDSSQVTSNSNGPGLSYDEDGNKRYFMHQNSANIMDICGITAEYVDLKTGELTKNVDEESYAILKKAFHPWFSNSRLSYNSSNQMVTVNNGDTDPKAFVSNVTIYLDIPMFTLSSTNSRYGLAAVKTKIYWADPSVDINSVDDFSNTYTATFAYKFPDGSTEFISSREVTALDFVDTAPSDWLVENVTYNVTGYSRDDGVECGNLHSYVAMSEVYISKDTTFYIEAVKRQFYVAFTYFDINEGKWKCELRASNTGEVPIPPEGAQNAQFTGWIGIDNINNGKLLSELTEVESHKYDYHDLVREGAYKEGMEPGEVIRTFNNGRVLHKDGGYVWNYYNFLQSYPYYIRNNMIVQSYCATYRDCDVTFVYGNEDQYDDTGNEGRDVKSEVRTYEIGEQITAPSDSTAIDGYGIVRGWDNDGDGINDYELDDYGMPILPIATEDSIILRGIYEIPDINLHIQKYDGDNQEYVDFAVVSVPNNLELVFEGKDVTFGGEKIYVDGATTDCFTQAIEASSDFSKFYTWQLRMPGWDKDRWLKTWNAYTFKLSYFTPDLYIRPTFEKYLTVNFVPGELEQFNVKNEDGTTTAQDSLTQRVLMYDNTITPHELIANIYPSSDGETRMTLKGWDADGDGVADYSHNIPFYPEKNMTLTAVYETEPLVFRTEILVPDSFEPEFPESAKKYITEETAEDGTITGYLYEGPYTAYTPLEEYLDGLYNTTHFVDSNTGYETYYYLSSAEEQYHYYYPGGTLTEVKVYKKVEIKEGHVGHTVIFDAGEGGYFLNLSGGHDQTFSKEVDNGVHDISDYTCWSSTIPKRDRPDASAQGFSSEYSVDYWTDEDGNKLEDGKFTVDKKGMTLTAHWKLNRTVDLDTTDEGSYMSNGINSDSGYHLSSMWMSEGTHKFSELNKPTQTYYPDLYFYEVVGWKDSRDESDIIHGLDEEFTLTEDDGKVTFTAVWKQTGSYIEFKSDNNFKQGTGNPIAPNHDFNWKHSITLKYGTYKVSDFPVPYDEPDGIFSRTFAGWEDENGKVYRIDDPDAEIEFTNGNGMTLTAYMEVSGVTFTLESGGGTFSSHKFPSYECKYSVGELKVDDLEVPVRKNTEYEEYTFKGWNIYENDTYNATECNVGDTFNVDGNHCYTAVALWDTKELKHHYSYGYDADSHWLICLNENCSGIEDSKEKHTPDDDMICKVCGYGCVTPETDEDGNYVISNAAELYGFAKLVNDGKTDANAVLSCDVTVNSNVLGADGSLAGGKYIAWTPIGNDSTKYSGTFDGRGYSVRGLYYIQSDSEIISNLLYIGFFGYTDGAVIKNLEIADSYFDAGEASSYAGGITAKADNSTISCCENRASVNAMVAGGIAGTAMNTEFVNCSNTGNVDALISTAGIVPHERDGSIKNCFNAGNVAKDLNGRAEPISDSLELSNCYYNSDIIDGEVDERTGVKGMTAEEFASGSVAYLLQQGQTADEDGNIPEIWGQEIGVDKYPVIGGMKVAKTEDGYSNPDKPVTTSATTVTTTTTTRTTTVSISEVTSGTSKTTGSSSASVVSTSVEITKLTTITTKATTQASATKVTTNATSVSTANTTAVSVTQLTTTVSTVNTTVISTAKATTVSTAKTTIASTAKATTVSTANTTAASTAKATTVSTAKTTVASTAKATTVSTANTTAASTAKATTVSTVNTTAASTAKATTVSTAKTTVTSTAKTTVSTAKTTVTSTAKTTVSTAKLTVTSTAKATTVSTAKTAVTSTAKATTVSTAKTTVTSTAKATTVSTAKTIVTSTAKATTVSTAKTTIASTVKTTVSTAKTTVASTAKTTTISTTITTTTSTTISTTVTTTTMSSTTISTTVTTITTSATTVSTTVTTTTTTSTTVSTTVTTTTMSSTTVSTTVTTTTMSSTTVSTTVTTTTTPSVTTPQVTEILGDANGDGKLDVRDAAHIARLLAQRKADKLPKNADFNGDGKVDVREAAAIAKFLAKSHKKN